jgi:hypothetical protein
VRKIRIDLGVPIEFANGVVIKKDPDNQHHWAIGTIKYSAVDGTPEKEDGRLIIDLPLPDPTRRTRCLGVLWAIGSKSRKPRLPMTTPTTSSAAALALPGCVSAGAAANNALLGGVSTGWVLGRELVSFPGLLSQRGEIGSVN